jgi:hypothetical protein
VDPSQDYTLYSGFVHLGAGLACGSTGMAAGYAIGIVGDSVRLMSKSSEAMLSMVHVVRPCLRPRIQGICDNGSDPHLCRGTRLVRVRASCCGAASESDVTESRTLGRLIVALIMNTRASDAVCL